MELCPSNPSVSDTSISPSARPSHSKLASPSKQQDINSPGFEPDNQSTQATTSTKVLQEQTIQNTSENEELLKSTLNLFNTAQGGEDIMHISLYATLGLHSIDHKTLFSTMNVVPLDTEELKEKLSYYQDKLYKRFSVKLHDLVRLETLGKGAFGEVTRVFNKTDREFYALKVVKRESFKKPIYYESAVWTEIQNLLKVTQNQDPAMLKTSLIDFDEMQDVCYLLMELGDGTLEEFAECKRKYNLEWTEKELQYVLLKIITQLLKLKELEMCHRDVKPSNVIISSRNDTLKLSDLGGSCIAKEGVQKLNITGTPHYMSPELIQAVMKRQVIVEHDPYASDLYSVGVTILALLDPTLKRKDFRDYLDKNIKEIYPTLYPVLKDLLGPPEKRKEAVEAILRMKIEIQSYHQLEAVNVGSKYKLYLHLKIVANNKNIETSFYFDMFILDDALMVIQKQIELLTEKMKEGDMNLEEVIWRIRLARCYYLQMRYEDAINEMEAIMQRKELKSFQTQNILTKARALLHRGIVKVKLGRIEEAVHDLMQCLGVRVSQFGETHEDVAAVFWQLGDTCLVQENWNGATKAFEKCINISEKLGNSERKYMAKSYNSLGLMLEKREKHEDALAYYEKAKETSILTHGEHHPAVADQYLAIAYTYIVLGKNEEGIALCNRAIEIKIKWYGEKNPEVAAAYAKTAKIYERLGKYQKVQELLYKSASIWKAVSGDDSQELADVYQLIGDALCKKGQYKKGLEYANRVIRIKENHLGRFNPRLAREYVWHAETCHALGQENEKRESIEKFTAINPEKLEPNITSIRVLLRVSRLLGEEGRIENAWDYSEKAFEMIKNLAVPLVSKAYSHYCETNGRLRRAEGKYRQAIKDVRESIAIREKITSKDFEIVASLYSLMGQLCEDVDQNEEALEWYQKSLDIIEKHLGKGTILMLKAYVDLARTFKKLGMDEDAQGKLNTAKILVKRLGINEHHPIVKSFGQIKVKTTFDKESGKTTFP